MTDRPARPPRGLLAIFAHPDDETFGVGGVLALAAGRGVPTYLVCATDGDLGGQAGARELDRSLRRGELRAAMVALGVGEPIFLGYRDSGMENWPRPADCFANADPEEVIGRLEAIMAELRPAVVLTFDPGGIYGHPDHVTISAHATEAYRRAARSPGGPRVLYHQAIPRSGLGGDGPPAGGLCRRTGRRRSRSPALGGRPAPTAALRRAGPAGRGDHDESWTFEASWIASSPRWRPMPARCAMAAGPRRRPSWWSRSWAGRRSCGSIRRRCRESTRQTSAAWYNAADAHRTPPRPSRRGPPPRRTDGA